MEGTAYLGPASPADNRWVQCPVCSFKLEATYHKRDIHELGMTWTQAIDKVADLLDDAIRTHLLLHAPQTNRTPY